MLAVSVSSSLATAEPCGISTVLYLFSLISGLWVRIIIVKKWVSSPPTHIDQVLIAVQRPWRAAAAA